jgi:serine/threonine-protein kinase
VVDVAWLGRQFPDLTALAPLGGGGQKEVFSAVHPDQGQVVLKVFHVGGERERALRELRASLELACARVPTTYGSGTLASPAGDVIWLCEERIEGTNLREILQRDVLADDQVIRLSQDLLAILTAAETREIVHRDVKPENIILAGDGEFWLIDFGLARHLGLTSLTATALPFGVGTPGYAPPEQFRNVKHEIDGRADLFGLGMTIYEACEGVNPLRQGARDIQEVLRRTENVPVARLRRSIAQSHDFTDLVQSLTRAKRIHRPESVAYARAWLEDILGDEDS